MDGNILVDLNTRDFDEDILVVDEKLYPRAKSNERRLGSTYPPDMSYLQMATRRKRIQEVPSCKVYCPTAKNPSSSKSDSSVNTRTDQSSNSSDSRYSEYSPNRDNSSRVGPIRGAGVTHRSSSSTSLGNVNNTDALNCERYNLRRNALCDPFRLLMPQKDRERIEQDVEKRRTSVARKVSTYVTTKLDLDREEDLI